MDNTAWMRLSHTLFYKISRTFVLLLWSLGIFQMALMAYCMLVYVDEIEQGLNWTIAQRLIPVIDDSLNNADSYWGFLNLTKTLSEINPKLDIFFIDRQGNLVLDFLNYTFPVRTKISLEPIQRFLAIGGRPDPPIYGDDPGHNVNRHIFSVAEYTYKGTPGYLYVVLSSHNRRAFLAFVAENRGIYVILLLFVASLFVAAGVGVTLFGVITRRFHRLTKVLQKYKSQDFSERLEVLADDEIDELSSTINQMVDTIKSSFEQLEHRDQMRRDLIANVSHDLRGPVAVINGFSEKLAGRWESLPRDEIKENSEAVLRNAQSLNRLLTELFELAKLDAREAKLDIAPFSMFQLLQDILSSSATHAAALKIELLDETAEDLPFVLGDVAKIERVVTNLVENALRYTPENGKVSVRTAVDGGAVVVEISDTGIGIPDQDLPHVFDRFYRVEKSKPRTGTSTGLGLAIVKRIIEAHGSNIGVRSKEGEGSTFSFRLHAAPK